MKESKTLDNLLKKWRFKNLLVGLVIVLGVLLLAYFLIETFNLKSLRSWLAVIISCFVFLGILYRYLPKLSDIISLLNHEVKEVQHSGHLLTKAETELSILQQIQKAKVESAISNSKLKLPFKSKPIFLSSCIPVISLLAMSIIFKDDPTTEISSYSVTEETTPLDETVNAQTDSLRLKSASAYITPPVYTKLKSYNTKNLALQIPEQSSVSWSFDVKGNPKTHQIIFEDQEIKNLSASYNYRRVFTASSFYNYRFAKLDQEIVSEYYPIKIIEDEEPIVKIVGVEEHQRLDFEENHDINFSIEASDDYGLTSMFISATLAKGTGESVKFREKQIEIKDLQSESRTYSGNYSFSTKALEMEPGDELYFYVAAKDNCPFENHWSKSATHFVVLKDTAQVILVDAGGMQLDLMPDFFRSQRQIIIDTEKLIAEQDTLPEKIFKDRSNELGYDQKLLRLKYGQFLGEEAESGLDFENEEGIASEGDEHDHTDPNHSHADDGSDALNSARSLIEQFMHDHDHEEEENQLLETRGTEKIEEAKNPQWVKDMSHSHDNMEEATFFDMSIKNKLRAALSGMWDSELHLRLADPEKALPFQYECLSYLDEIKNHARAYVQRIGFEPPVIKEQEKRLSGDLKEVYSTRDILKTDRDLTFAYIKAALPIILDIQQRSNKALDDTAINILQKAGTELSEVAIKNSAYLPVLSIIKRLDGDQNSVSEREIEILIMAMLEILPADKKEAVAARYFRHPINVKAIKEFKKSL